MRSLVLTSASFILFGLGDWMLGKLGNGFFNNPEDWGAAALVVGGAALWESVR